MRRERVRAPDRAARARAPRALPAGARAAAAQQPAAGVGGAAEGDRRRHR